MTGERDLDSRAEILFVIGQLGVGGTESHLGMVAPALVRKGWHVSVLPLSGEGPIGDVLRRGGVEIIAPAGTATRRHAGALRRGVGVAFAAYGLLRTLRKRRSAIVHFFLPAAYLIGGPVAALASTPIRVLSRRSLNAYQSSYPVVSAVEKRLHRSMTAILGNSLSVVRELHDHEGVPVTKLGLIYNGLDARRFATLEPRTAARAELGLPADALVFVTVANLIPYKGHADLLSALAIVKNDLPVRWRLLVAGRDDGIGGNLKHLAAELNLIGNVDFMGPRDDIPRLLAAADIGLLCSHEEGFSNALLEGMAAGLPMVATQVGGNAEAVHDNDSGLIVPPKDPARLAQAILRLVRDPGLRARLGAVARERVFRDFSLERCINSYDALYHALLAGRSVGDVEEVRVAAR